MEQVKLPIKTKIVVFSMVIISVYVIIIGLVLSYGFVGKYGRIFRYVAILNGLLFLILSFFLANKKKFSWWLSITMFSIIIISTILRGPLGGLAEFNILNIICAPFVAPLLFFFAFWIGLGGEVIGWLATIILLIILLLLLILDRKNFWKVAS